jgi:ABC-type antimicrobial peptide transport system permease subunit
VRQLVTEVAILALAGGALGTWAFSMLTGVVDMAKDGYEVSPNWETVCFTAAYALLTAMLCGLSPALHATRAGVADVLKGTSRGTTSRSRAQRAFVIAQIAIAQPLMVALAASLATIADEIRPAGNAMRRDQILIAEFDTYAGVNSREPDKIPGLVQRFAQVPGVEAALPIGYGQGVSSFELPSSDSLGVRAPAVVLDVPPNYFRAVDATVLRGREFVPNDTSATVIPVVVAESLAIQLFKSVDPIGKRIRRRVSADERSPEMEIVGVVRMNRDDRFLQFDYDYPVLFVPYVQRHIATGRPSDGLVLIRTSGPADRLIPTFMSVARDEARTLPVLRMRTLSQSDREYQDGRRQVAVVAAGCGSLALVLAAVGLFAMIGVAVGQRRREIGIRLALGARARQVITMFFVSGVRTTLFGLTLGLPLSLIALALLSREIGLPKYGVASVAIVVSAAVLGVASLASWLPARRSATVDPIDALRSD